MRKNISCLRHESYIALSSEIEPFAEALNKIISNGDNTNGNLRNSKYNFRCFGCMDSFWDWATNKKLENKFLFGFHVQPKWVENLVDEFNQEFKNFNIEIVWKRDLNIFGHKEWDGSSTYGFTDESLENVFMEAGTYIYRLNEYIELQPKTRRQILYIFHHFLRSCSIGERIVNPYDTPPHNNYIDYVLDKNNKYRGGRALTDFFANKEDFLALDDEVTLKSFDRLVATYILKQSDIIFIADMIKKYGEDYFTDIPWETDCLPNHPKTFYGLFISTGGYVYAKRKPMGNGVITHSHTYNNDNDFFHTRVRIDFKTSRVNRLKQRYSYNNYNEGGVRSYQIVPLVALFSRYPELDYNIIPKIVDMVNENLDTTFKIPSEESFIME